MKKLLFTALTLLACTALFTGCSKNDPEYFEKHFTAEARIDEISIDVRDRTIEVVRSEDDKLRLDYFDSGLETLELAENSGTLTVTAVNNKEWTDYIGAKAPESKRTLTLSIPEGRLASLSLATTNADITLESVSSERFSLTVNGGDLRFDTLGDGADITLSAKNGSIKGTIGGAYEDYAITHTIKKGDTNLPESKESGSRTLTVTENNGDVEIEFSGK